MADNKNKNQNNASQKKNSGVGKAIATPFRWFFRMFNGASKDLDIFEVEKLESPSKQAVKAFFRRKLAVAALVVLVSLFLFVFIAPLFIPMDSNYTDTLQANLPPNFSMLKVPAGLKDNVRTISGFSNFTIGVSNDNDLYIWGITKDALTEEDYADFPADIKDGNVYTASAGKDHIVAITTDGKVVAWGANNCGQYGDANEADGYRSMTKVLEAFKKENGDIVLDDVSKVQQLICAYQITGLVYDGQLYVWGNTRNYTNVSDLVKAVDKRMEDDPTAKVSQIAFSNYYAIVSYENGKIDHGSYFDRNTRGVSNFSDEKVKAISHLGSKKIVDITASKDSFIFLADDGEMIVTNATQYGEDVFPAIPEGETVVNVEAGTRHIVAVTENGKAYAWGHNADKQADFFGADADKIFTGAKQTYLLNSENEVTEKHGMRGYLFGTDGDGRDTFTRIVHGGKMTMTIGAVAVIISSIIAIIIGCISGYFGGWVDILLMRITEICASIPFLPFAMMLSIIIRNSPINDNETLRIFIIMVMLGLLSWTGLARMIRAQVLSEREKEFVIAAKSMGVKEKRIAFKHILPNIISVILVSMTLDFAGCLLTESSLSYLGFGVQQPQPTWGNMLNGANNSIVIQNFWWQWVFPAIFLSIATISINIIGDTLRDVLDTKSSREK